MRDHPSHRLRLDELIEELQEIRKEHGDLYTNVRPPDLIVTQQPTPKTLIIRSKS